MKKFLPPKLIIICLMIGMTNPSTLFSQTPLSFTKIPYSDPDLNAPGRGVEQWHNANLINVPVEGTNTPRLDAYYRFTWNRLETTQGNYDWTYLDDLFENCIDNGQKISFGIMTCYPGGAGESGVLNYDSGYSAYPLYLHTLMQSETNKDWKTNGTGPTTGIGTWVPNWNSSYYLDRLLALNQAVNNHINTTSYNSVAFKDIVNSIDIRGYGSWGEWHSGGIIDTMGSYPSGRRPTVATLKTIIDHHKNAFPNFPLSLMISVFDAEWLNNTLTPKEVTSYALGLTNNWGKFGWRRDNWGALDEYLSDYLVDNDRSYNGGPEFRIAIMDRWKEAPITGEPPNWLPSSGGTCAYDDLENQIRLYHATSFGNGNYGTATPATCMKDYVRAASKAAGYRIILDTGSITSTITRGTAFSVTLNWKNVGIAPTYENWNVTYELKNSSNVVVWSAASSFVPKLFLPSTSANVNTDNGLTIPTSVPNGNYTLNLIIKDPTGYRAPLPLAITGRNADGSYTLKNITFSGGCTTPTAVLSNTPACSGGAFNLTLTSATGASPYDLVINGTTYNDKTVSSTITSFTPTAQKIWTTNPSVINNEDSPVELGVKFQSSVAGYIRGVRFFSSDDVGGTYKGNLWSSTGTLLQSKNFTSVTPLAWQEIIFDAPLAIAANTTYVASYHTTAGYYASTTSGLSSAVTNGSLTALASGTSGGNGVYTYGSTSAFPTSSYNSSNYWADVLFVPDTYTFNLTSVTDNNGCVLTGSPLQSLVVESDPCTGGRPAYQPPVTQINTPEMKWNYDLKQSYPNPTNDKAKIVYTLPQRTTVNLSVYDMHGRLIKVLVNGEKDKGEHTVNADMAPFAKGIYYYKMHAKDFSATRKLIIQ